MLRIKKIFLLLISLILLVKLFLINSQKVYNQYTNGKHIHPHRLILQHQLTKEPNEAFINWHYLHKRDYHVESDEGKLRFQNFRKNFELIKAHNANNYSFKLGLNHFADFTLEEFHEKFLHKNSLNFKKMQMQIKKGFESDIDNKNPNPSIKNPSKSIKSNLNEAEVEKKSKEFYELFWNSPDDEINSYNYENKKNGLRFLESDDKSSYSPSPYLSKSIDWYLKASLDRMIDDQGKCGSCWAFSAVQAIEAAYKLQTGKYEVFSKQQLVDCDDSSNGCDGGMPHLAYEYFKKNGILTEKEYPYKENLTKDYKKNCPFKDNKEKENKSKLKVKSYEVCLDTDKKCHNDESMFEMLERGPISACVDASKEFMLYESGIYDMPCKEINHAIFVTGYYKSQKEGEDSYWLVKNSWSYFWGDIGFIKIKQSKNYNSCLLNTYYSRPVLDV
jgi:cathepsin L